jgi:hypothetical protein
VAVGEASRVLVDCLRLLGQAPAADLARDKPEEILSWATGHWQATAIPRRTQLPAPESAMSVT